jgi:hypothetical protein
MGLIAARQREGGPAHAAVEVKVPSVSYLIDDDLPFGGAVAMIDKKGQ